LSGAVRNRGRPLPNQPLPLQQGNLPPPPGEQRKRRWTVKACEAFGLPDVKGQNQILGSAVATCARIDQTMLQPGTGAALPPGQTNDQAYAAFVRQVQIYENVRQPRNTRDGQALLQAAQLARQSVANAQQVDQAKLDAIDDVLAALKAFELRDAIMAKGKPPWDMANAQEATQAKVELDMLSIPRNQRTMTVQGGGVNPSYWVNRSTPGTGQPIKSFLCKPASTQPMGPPTPIPVGGEVAREALTTRAGKLLGDVLKLGVDIPETHVVSIPPGFFPNQQGGQNNQTCSVQEAKSVQGDVTSLTRQQKAQIPPEQCAGIAFLDLMTLNTDRHVGNLLVDHSGGLVPIDHGVTFPSDDGDGKSRIQAAISGPHNALLRLPGTHAPMTDEMALSLQNLDPTQLRNQLGQAQQQIGNTNNAMAGKISDESLDMSLASTRFMKIAAGITGKDKKTKDVVRLSPGAIQVAFGAYSDELLALPPPQDGLTAAFDQRAIEILTEALKDQEVIAQVAQFDGSAYATMRSELKTLRWKVELREQSAEFPGIQSDPAICAKLIAGKIQCPLNTAPDAQLPKARELLGNLKKPIAPKQVLKAVANMELRTIVQIARMLPRNERRALVNLIKSKKDELRQDHADRKTLVEQATAHARTVLTAEVQKFQRGWDIGNNYLAMGWFNDSMRSGDIADAAKQVQEMQKDIDRGGTPYFTRKNPREI
jgi:Phosphatidylinositol 3- and 4-kinase